MQIEIFVPDSVSLEGSTPLRDSTHSACPHSLHNLAGGGLTLVPPPPTPQTVSFHVSSFNGTVRLLLSPHFPTEGRERLRPPARLTNWPCSLPSHRETCPGSAGAHLPTSPTPVDIEMQRLAWSLPIQPGGGEGEGNRRHGKKAGLLRCHTRHEYAYCHYLFVPLFF